MGNLEKYRYTILNYAPNAVSGPVTACLVFAEDILNTERPRVKVFVYTQWDKNILEDHREYITELIKYISSISESDMDQFLLGIQDLSVGPLRVGFIEDASKSSLHEVLSTIFKVSDYSVLR